MDSPKPRVQSFQDLFVWQKAHEFGQDLLRVAKDFPRTDEARIIKNQLLRAGLSIGANIAEGYGGTAGKSFANYLTIARRSSSETENWLLVARDSAFLSSDEYGKLSGMNTECLAMLSAFIKKLNS